MDRSNDYEVLKTALKWLDLGEAVVLVTVVSTWGSAPRRPGALMVIHADGEFVGSVSGGCIEDDLVQLCQRGEFAHTSPRLIEYGVNSAQTQRVSLPCGGRLQLLVEYLDTAATLRKVLDVIKNGQSITRRVCLATSEVSLHQPADRTSRSPAWPRENLLFDGENLYKVFGPAWRMLIIGAGELSRRVAQLALTLDYAVTICDPRPEYAIDAGGNEGAGASSGATDDASNTGVLKTYEFSNRAPAELINDFAPDQHTVILALAHSPPLEDDALAAALQSHVCFTGALGSSKNQQGRKQRLSAMGLSQAQLARLQGPVGLDIGSHTPAEIAIAIMASLIQLRNKPQPEGQPEQQTEQQPEQQPENKISQAGKAGAETRSATSTASSIR